jgi:hypothetical protein
MRLEWRLASHKPSRGFYVASAGALSIFNSFFACPARIPRFL